MNFPLIFGTMIEFICFTSAFGTSIEVDDVHGTILQAVGADYLEHIPTII